jgi:hypothetical protein
MVRKASAKLDSEVGIVISSVSQSPANLEMILPLDVICYSTHTIYIVYIHMDMYRILALRSAILNMIQSTEIVHNSDSTVVLGVHAEATCYNAQHRLATNLQRVFVHKYVVFATV